LQKTLEKKRSETLTGRPPAVLLPIAHLPGWDSPARRHNACSCKYAESRPIADGPAGRRTYEWETFMARNQAIDVLKDTWSEFSRDDCGTLAAALAYYTVFSLPAALLIIVKIAGSVLGEQAVTGQLQAQIGASMGPQVGNEIGAMIQKAAHSTTGGTLALIFGIAGLWWSATNITNQLQTALNRAWSVKPKEESIKGMLKKRLGSFLLIVGVGVLVLIALAASAAVAPVSASFGLPGGLIHIGEIVVTFFIFAFLFGAVYRVLPDARVDWSDVRTGGLVTAALFVAGKFLIGLYLGHTSVASGYGVAGSLALLLLWTYYSSLIFLAGAEFTQVWVRRHGKQIEPDRDAVRVIKEREPSKAA
jgi:membrane protein